MGLVYLTVHLYHTNQLNVRKYMQMCTDRVGFGSVNEESMFLQMCLAFLK